MRGGKANSHQSDTAYTRRIDGDGLSHRERSLQKVPCTRCGQFVARQYLEKHRRTRKCQRASTPTPAPDFTPPAPSTPIIATPLPMTYRCSVPPFSETACPAVGCPYVTPDAETRGNGFSARSMRVHFRSRHPADIIIVEEEGPEALPKCPRCGLFQRHVGAAHQATADCRKYEKAHQQRLAATVQAAAQDTVFTIHGVPIRTVKSFRYLGRLLDDRDDDRPAVARNLGRARQKWGSVARILSKQGARPKAMASFYKAIVMSILLYGSESWVLTKSMMRELESFHRRCARCITGRHIRERADGSWHCPDTAVTLDQAGLFPIDEYIKRRTDTVKAFVEKRAIYRRCLASRPLASSINQLVWWKTIRSDA